MWCYPAAGRYGLGSRRGAAYGYPGCWYGPWAWRSPTVEEEREWLEGYKEELEVELKELEKRLETLK
ncbi:MAG: DUF5320 family protein [Candidatus Bipolaricaulia bacterium]